MKKRMAERLARLRAQMDTAAVDLVALGPGAHMCWLLGFHPHADERFCLLLVGPEREAFVMPALNAEDTQQKSDIEMHSWDDADGPGAALKFALSATGTARARSVSLDETMRADFAIRLLEELPDAKSQFTADTVGALRMRKDETEYASLKENAGFADVAMLSALDSLEPGISELEVARIVRETFIAQGAEPKFNIVGSGPNGALPHHATGERTVKKGDAIVIDIGAGKGEFTSDITRVAVMDEPPEEFDKVHSIVENAVLAAMEAACPGARAADVDNAARTVISDAGYGEHFVHRTGHGLGVEVHEPPYIMSSSELVLDEGMVFSIEPGIYLTGRFGVRLEEIVFLRADGPEILSELPRNRYLCTSS